MKPELQAMLLALEAMRKIDPGMSLHRLMLFLMIAMDEGVSQRTLEARAGLYESTTHRNVQALLGANGRPKLIRQVQERDDQRGKGLHLTARGRWAARQIEDCLSRFSDDDEDG